MVGRENAQIPNNSYPSHHELQSQYHHERQMQFVYGSGDVELAKAYKKILDEFAAKNQKYNFKVLSDLELSESELITKACFLIGTPKNNRHIARLMPELPFNVTENTLEFNQHQYGSNPILQIRFYPNPHARNIPLNILTGLIETDIFDFLKSQTEQYYWWGSLGRWGYLLKEGKIRKEFGYFDESDPKQWKIGGEESWDFSASPKIIQNFLIGDISAHQIDLSTPELEFIADKVEQDIRTLMLNLPSHKPLPKLDIHIYPSCETKGMITGLSEPVSASPEDYRLDLVYNEIWKQRGDQEINRIALQHVLGKPSIIQLEDGLAVKYCQNWEYQGWEYWLGRLHRGEQSPSLEELLSEDIYAHESPILNACYSAALVSFLHKQLGKEAFWELYRGKSQQISKLLKLESQWFEFLDEISILSENETLAYPGANIFEYQPFSSHFLKGFNFAHEGYEIYNGYLGTNAEKSLTYTAQELHSNSTAIIPYSGMRDVNKPDWFDFSRNAASENDESVIHCIHKAHEAGMAVMLKPQIWPWNSWTGEVEMKSENDWQLFFDRYYRWIRHYALLAEIHGAEMLCVGVEFSKATLQRPDDWRKMIAKIRKIYHGKLTYAANWGPEFEECKFWDAVDFIGLNCYYPLSKSNDLRQSELDKGFSETMDKVGKIATKAGKPLVFTEIGFRSCERAWQNPHEEANERAASNDAQLACYKAMIEGLKTREWFSGILLWKWPAYMRAGKSDYLGFTPLAKPAEALTAKWFLDLPK